MLTPDQIRKLERLHNRATLYELAAVNGDRRVLIAYCGRHSRIGLLHACRGQAERLMTLTGDKTIGFGKRASAGATMGAWSIRFTGRTKRDAIMEGELMYIGRLEAESDPEAYGQRDLAHAVESAERYGTCGTEAVS